MTTIKIDYKRDLKVSLLKNTDGWGARILPTTGLMKLWMKTINTPPEQREHYFSAHAYKQWMAVWEEVALVASETLKQLKVVGPGVIAEE